MQRSLGLYSASIAAALLIEYVARQYPAVECVPQVSGNTSEKSSRYCTAHNITGLRAHEGRDMDKYQNLGAEYKVDTLQAPKSNCMIGVPDITYPPQSLSAVLGMYRMIVKDIRQDMLPVRSCEFQIPQHRASRAVVVNDQDVVAIGIRRDERLYNAEQRFTIKRLLSASMSEIPQGSAQLLLSAHKTNNARHASEVQKENLDNPTPLTIQDNLRAPSLLTLINKPAQSIPQAHDTVIEEVAQIAQEVSKEVAQIAQEVSKEVAQIVPEVSKEVVQIALMIVEKVHNPTLEAVEKVAQTAPKIVKEAAQLPVARDEAVQSPQADTKPMAYTLPKTEENLQPTSLQLPYTLPQTHPKPGQKTKENEYAELLPLPGTPPAVNGEKVVEIGGFRAAFRAQIHQIQTPKHPTKMVV